MKELFEAPARTFDSTINEQTILRRNKQTVKQSCHIGALSNIIKLEGSR